MGLDLKAANQSLESASPQEILVWAENAFSGEIAMSSSFQTQSVPLLHMVSSSYPQLPILFIDTGYHFPETIAFRDRLVDSLGLNLVILKGEQQMEDGAFQVGKPLYLTNPDLCCHIRKVEPMRKAIGNYRAWISGIRRDQSATRARIRVVENTGEQHIRIHPMINWSQADVQRYITQNDLPEHPLGARGFISIGCAPCTRPPLLGEDPRSGRWVGAGKTECGLHTTLRDSTEEEK